MSTPSNVPLDRTRFFGRDDDLAAIRALLARPDVGLLTLTGVGGTGKTRLAVAVAREDDVRAAFPDGVWFVDLTTVSEAANVGAAVARVLGARERADEAIAATLGRAIGAKTMLVVLDNCEHVLAAMPIVADLLAACPGLKVLATSRAPLGLHAEHELPVAPLPVVDLDRLGDRPLDDVLGLIGRSPAVALFVARAETVSPGFRLSAANTRAVVEVCRALDGLPLAIELAAGRTRVLSPEAMRERLDHRLALLTGGGRDRPPRQQTMRDSLAWSYEFLALGEQTALRRLGVFVGGFTAHAAEVVVGAAAVRGRRAAAEGDRSETTAGAADDQAPGAPGASGGRSVAATPDDIVSALDGLMAKGLVRPLDPVAGDGRFAMLETVREFALEVLEASGEADAVRPAHAAWVADLAERAMAGLTSPALEHWLERLDADLGNIRSALAWSLAPGGDPATAVRIGGCLRVYWDHRGQLTEGRRWLDEALAASAAADLGRLRALNAAGLLAWRQGDFPAARDRFAAALELATRLGNRIAVGKVTANLGLLAFESGDFAGALEHFTTALAAARDTGDLNMVGTNLCNIGSALAAEGDYGAARPCYEEAIVLHRQGGDQQLLLDAIENLAINAGDLGDMAAARTGIEEVLATRRARGDRVGTAKTLARLSIFAKLEGHRAQAARHVHESLALYREMEDSRGMLEVLVIVAVLLGSPTLRPLHRATPRIAHHVPPPLEDLQAAARLIAASTAGRAAHALGFTQAESKVHEANLIALKTALGRRAFAAAWATGEAIGLDGAVDEALAAAARLAERGEAEAGAGFGPSAVEIAAAAPVVPAAPAAPVDDGGLSPRELEVAMLIAANLTYRQIAERLNVSVKSVEKHMGSILAKLDAKNRLEVAAWASARAGVLAAGANHPAGGGVRPSE